MNSALPSKKNRLASEKSPYLLQHATNPVDWFAWGQEAFEKAKREDKVIFLSIGYSTCHWCHVMEKESFEDAEVAKLLNEHFVSIKVDREERSDIDQIYMSAVQAMAGQGGWPLTVFLTPEKKPFAGGTYFPKDDSWGRPGMTTLLPRIAEAWKKDKERLLKAGDEILTLLVPSQESPLSGFPEPNIFNQSYHHFISTFDTQYGGFGGAPKFPRSHELSFLLRFGNRTHEPEALNMVEKTLQSMARGGLYDQIGGGFHRYSTDERWLVPHFEKMLYDQALLAKTYAEAYKAVGEPLYAEITRDIFHYLKRDMTHPMGGFFSAQDADSEGEEGKFYVWRPEEVVKVLGKEKGEILCEYFGITDQGNFEHACSVLHIPVPEEGFIKAKNIKREIWCKDLSEARQSLFEERRKRIPPSKDDKILSGWNGLMISALSVGAGVLDSKDYLKMAEEAAGFILKHLQVKERLMRRWREGEASVPAFQEDYAFFILGLLDLYEASFETRWFEEALRLTEEMIRLFWDGAQGGFFYTGEDAEALISRTKEYYDGAIPSGNSVAALVLLRMARMLDRTDFEKMAERVVASNRRALEHYPAAYPQMLTAIDFAQNSSRHCEGPACQVSPQDLGKLKEKYGKKV